MAASMSHVVLGSKDLAAQAQSVFDNAQAVQLIVKEALCL